MRPTDVLKEEHQVILKVLESLSRMTDGYEANGAIDPIEAAAVVAFLRNFADTLHHGKEEARLFPAMEANGFPRQGGPVAVMILEHDQGRALVGSMASAVESGSVEGFVTSARTFVLLLTQHIEKEDHCLFSMAEGALSPEQAVALCEGFASYDASAENLAARKAGLELAERLAEKYGVVRVAAMAGACH